MLRPLLYTLSRSTLVPRLIGTGGWTQRAARRFVAGETLAEAIAAAQQLNSQGFLVALNYLGEHAPSREDALRAAAEYQRALDAIDRHRAQAYLSIKLSQLGLDIDETFCREQVCTLLERAQGRHIFIRIDMESSAYTERTLHLYHTVHTRFANVGIVIQANLRRSAADLERLIAVGADIRLVKGAYLEPPALAYEAKRDVDANYLRLLDRLLSPEAQQRGVRVAIATHDERIINWAKRAIHERGIPRDRSEFQMLYGIRRDLQRRLAAAGYRMRVYVPYGSHWYPYLMRRLAERPANLLFLLRNLLRG